MATDVPNASSQQPEPDSVYYSLYEAVDHNFGALMVAACINFAVVALLFHVAIYREWLPYKAVLLNLVLYTGLAVRLLQREKACRR